MPRVPTAKVEIVSAEVGGRARLELPPIAGRKRHAQLARYPLGHVGLHAEHVGHRRVERLLPPGRTGRRLDKLGAYAHATPATPGRTQTVDIC